MEKSSVTIVRCEPHRLQSFGYLCVVCRCNPDAPWLRFFSHYDPREVYFRRNAARKRYGSGNVAVLNRNGWRMSLRKCGGGSSTRYEVIRDFDALAPEGCHPLIAGFNCEGETTADSEKVDVWSIDDSMGM